jgi:hypothetical protein
MLHHILRPYLPPNVDIKEKARDVRKQAIVRKLIQTGHRVTEKGYSPSNRRIIAAEYIDNNVEVSKEMYVRLLPKGRELAGQKHAFSGTIDNIATRSTLLPKNESVSTQTGSETDEASLEELSNDSIWICRGIQILEADKHSEWVDSGGVGIAFRKNLPNRFASASSNEDMNKRFRNARNAAITGGLVEMGRLKLNASDNTYIAVPLFNSPANSDASLSTETYLRLLPAGRCAVAAQSQQSNSSDTIPRHNKDDSQGPSILQRCLFVNNFAISTEALQVAEFFEATFACSVEQVELKLSNVKGKPSIAAHIEFSSADRTSMLVQKSKGTGIIYKGCRLYVVCDRTTPYNIAMELVNRPTEMSFSSKKPLLKPI